VAESQRQDEQDAAPAVPQRVEHAGGEQGERDENRNSPVIFAGKAVHNVPAIELPDRQ